MWRRYKIIRNSLFIVYIRVAMAKNLETDNK